MGKRFSLLAIVCLFAFLLTGCEGKQDPVSGGTGESRSAAETQAEQPPADDKGYLDVTCRKVDGYSRIYVGMNQSNTVLSLAVPNEWSLAERANGSGYDILRENVSVGSMYLAQIPEDHDEICLSHTKDENYLVTVESCVLKADHDGGCGYLRRFHYSYQDGESRQDLVIEADYAELSTFSANKLRYSDELTAANSEPGIGALKQFRKNGRDSVLILGNSFIGTSQIGGILKAMCAAGGQNTTVEAVSIGYATVSSYAEDGTFPELIRSGNYGIVLMCGFYNSDATEKLRHFVDACRASDTMLVIFPAHNESASVISSACSKWKDDAYVLDWKGEIDALIQYQGISRSDFCIDDQHQHSTPLAGFVGAHMIYRALYNRIPPAVSGLNMSTASARRYLGSYVDTGCFTKIDESEIYRFYP